MKETAIARTSQCTVFERDFTRFVALEECCLVTDDSDGSFVFEKDSEYG